jgi:asparagine synthetase B (glutamine-hydrolysing)
LIPLGDGGVFDTPLDDVVQGLRRPTHSTAPFLFLPLYEAIKEHGFASVVTGDGADEVFAGHAYHREPGSAWMDGTGSLLERYRSARGLEMQIHVSSLFGREYLDEFGTRRRWELSQFARAIELRARAIESPWDRLRFMDVAIRLRPQCIELQARLAAFAGLVYAAPISDPRVIRAALARPIDPKEKEKAPLREYLIERLGERWQEETNEPFFAAKGSRSVSDLPPGWRAALNTSTTVRNGIFQPARIESLLSALDPSAAYFPRELMIVATAHRSLSDGADSRARVDFTGQARRRP